VVGSLVAQFNWTEEFVAALDCTLEIDRLPVGVVVVPPVELTTPAQPLSPRLKATPASVSRKNSERRLAEYAALNIWKSPQSIREISQRNSDQFRHAVRRLLRAAKGSNWTLDANEGNTVGGLSTVQKGNTANEDDRKAACVYESMIAKGFRRISRRRKWFL